MQYFIVLVFFSYFIYKSWRNIVYLIPFVLILYTNINSLVSNDIIPVGGIDLSDIGLFISFLLITIYYKNILNFFTTFLVNNHLLIIITIYFGYLIFLVIYSLALNESILWIIKISRYTFYGISFYFCLYFLLKNTQLRFKLFTTIINTYTFFISILFILYSQFDLPIFLTENVANEINNELNLELKRNLYAFPALLPFCYLSILNKIKDGETSLKNIVFIVTYFTAIIYSMTRGLFLQAIIFIPIVLLWGKISLRKTSIAIIIFISIGFIYSSKMLYKIDSYKLLISRIDEVQSEGFKKTKNIEVRSYWLNNTIKNVNDFMPVFGFGFTRTQPLGYDFMTFHAGCPDNAIAQILGMQGYLGVLFYLTIIALWYWYNYQIRKKLNDQNSNTNFFYLTWLILSGINGNGISFFYYLAPFIAYDIIMFEKLKLLKLHDFNKRRSKSLNYNTLL